MSELKANKRKPGLRLTSKHLQPANASPSPNSSSQSSNSRFKEQIGNIVNGGGHHTDNYVEEEETSLAAVYLQSTNQDLKNANIPVLREPPLPPPVDEPMTEASGSHFMEMKVEDLETLSRLGEGAAGTVRKVLHKPTQMIMAKKVYIHKQQQHNFFFNTLVYSLFLQTLIQLFSVKYYVNSPF